MGWGGGEGEREITNLAFVIDLHAVESEFVKHSAQRMHHSVRIDDVRQISSCEQDNTMQ